MTKKWRLPNCPDMAISVKPIWELIKRKQLDSHRLDINTIAYKDIEDIDILGDRYQQADLKFPGIVVENMYNPYNKQYRLIDGRHRLLKTINLGEVHFNCYILPRHEVNRFIELI